MIHTIRVISKNETDPKGQNLLAEIKSTLNINSIKKIRTAKVYRLEGISKKDLKKIIDSALVEKIDQKYSVDEPIFNSSSKNIEVAYKSGVMNPEVASILKTTVDLNIKLAAADSSFEYAFFGTLSKDQLQKIINRLLVNETVEHIVSKKPKTLLISGKTPKVQIVPIRNLTDSQLLDLSTNRLFLNLEEMKVIQNYFKKENRDPSDCEIEVLAQTWSEHCTHKTFKANLTIDGKKKKPLFERIKSTAGNNNKIIVSAFHDNSGVIDFYDGWAINGKGETHNSPSAIEPYGGAMTGSGGVFRDIAATGKGAKVICSTDIFCFAPPDLPNNKIPPGCLPPLYLLKKVVAGVRDYGNRVGIPTNNGSVHFHEDFRAKPTVAVGSYGLIPKKHAKKKAPNVNDLIITIGGATGRDGIHGATFASGEMTHQTGEVLGSSVQIGNAIEEKRILDVVITLRNENLIRAVTDCGAGGYSSAIGEMGEIVGAKVQLDNVPLKYTGLAPWEIFLSESQERLILAIDSKNIKKVQKICKLYNVQISILGKFDGSKKLSVRYKNQIVCDMPMKFIHDGLPQRNMIGKSRKNKLSEKLPKQPKNLLSIWQKILTHPNVASKEPIVRMYDHNVQGTSALHPFGGENLDAPNDAVVLRPILNKKYGFITAHGLNPILNRIDPYWGSIWAIVEAVSNYVAVGGDLKNASLIDNFIWPFPDSESLASLDKSVDACVDVAKVLKMTFVSGKDSLSSTYRYPEGPGLIESETLRVERRSPRTDGKVLKIPPVLLISVFGKIPNIEKTASSDFKKVGSAIVSVGKSDFKNLGGSTYFDVMNSTSNKVPQIDLKVLPKTLKSITKGIQSEQILSAHDISEGGMATTLFEMCLGGQVGAQIDLSKLTRQGVSLTGRPDFILFSETAGTFLVEVESEKIAKRIFRGVPHQIIGKTQKEKLININRGKNKLASASIQSLKNDWQKPMMEIFK